MDEKKTKQEEVTFTSLEELSKYNQTLLKGFVNFLNKKHKKTRNIFQCLADIQIIQDEKLLKEFDEFIINSIKKNNPQPSAIKLKELKDGQSFEFKSNSYVKIKNENINYIRAVNLNTGTINEFYPNEKVNLL